jgi:hypothetical protein
MPRPRNWPIRNAGVIGSVERPCGRGEVMDKVASFEIGYTGCPDLDGRAVGGLPVFAQE